MALRARCKLPRPNAQCLVMLRPRSRPDCYEAFVANMWRRRMPAYTAGETFFPRGKAIVILPLDLVSSGRSVSPSAHISVLNCMCLARGQPEPRPLATPSQDLSRCREQRYFSQAVFNYLAVLLVCGAFSLNQ
jgi:hypothetical protein